MYVLVCGFAQVSSDLLATYCLETDESAESFIGLGQQCAVCNNKEGGWWEELSFKLTFSPGGPIGPWGPGRPWKRRFQKSDILGWWKYNMESSGVRKSDSKDYIGKRCARTSKSNLRRNVKQEILFCVCACVCLVRILEVKTVLKAPQCEGPLTSQIATLKG